MQNNFDRGMIKWMPFNALTPSKQMVNDLVKEKNKIKKPILSDDQINIIEQNLITAYYEKEKVNISYYQNGQIYSLNEVIKKIDFTYHKIYLSSKVILFNQIIKISLF